MSAGVARAPDTHLSPTERIVLARLTRAADAGAACPGNEELMEAIGAASVSTASSVVGALARKGVISVERHAKARTVTIVATGRSTARPAAARPHWRDRPNAAPSRNERAKEQLVDAMSDGAPSLEDAARALRLPRSLAFALWREVRAGLGPQAA